MIRRLLVASVLALNVPYMAAAQTAEAETTRRNAFYFELFGSGGLYSVNYERQVGEPIRLRAGLGAWTAVDLLGGPGETRLLTVPVTISVVSGHRSHRLEAGGGVLFGRRTTDQEFAGPSGAFVSLVGFLGYRYEPPRRGFLFRAGFTPMFGFGAEETAYPEKGFFPSLGVSFGYRFR